MWVYNQATGALVDGNGSTVAHGYSGRGNGKNNPKAETFKSIGPIPRGKWKIGEMEDDHPNLGPRVMALTPVGHDARGRSAFFIHGDSVKKPGTASHGCIILPRAIREKIAASGDVDLLVED